MWRVKRRQGPTRDITMSWRGLSRKSCSGPRQSVAAKVRLWYRGRSLDLPISMHANGDTLNPASPAFEKHLFETTLQRAILPHQAFAGVQRHNCPDRRRSRRDGRQITHSHSTRLLMISCLYGVSKWSAPRDGLERSGAPFELGPGSLLPSV